jgi:tyrosine-protein kinase Etk/Wzc
MSESQNINIQEENDFKKISELFLRHYKLFIISAIAAVVLAFLINYYSVPIYSISSSILIKENTNNPSPRDANDYLNSSILGKSQNFQNELWVLKSSPVIDKSIRNLDLEVSYYTKSGFQYVDAYHAVPFKVLYLKSHSQPIDVRFELKFLRDGYYQLNAKSGKIANYDFVNEQITGYQDKWLFTRNARFGELVETPDLSFVIKLDSTKLEQFKKNDGYAFEFKSIAALNNEIKNSVNFNVVDKIATVIEITMKTQSLFRGIDIVDEMMNVYSLQNLERKNHIAGITISYIEKQLNEISDSLSQTEDHLQNFRSANQVLNVSEQASGISTQYMNLQNQLAELVTRKKYYDYVSGYLTNNDNFSNIMLPASMGIQDQLLNTLMSELISAQAQRANLIENKQERNPLVQKLGIQIENAKKTIFENISAAGKTTNISIEEMTKRIQKTESEISRLPITQRKLGNIERKYRLNDAIYNYLLEKRAEAKITTASNLPDDIIIEPAKLVGLGPISPKKKLNYILSLFMGMALPFGYLMLKSSLNNKIEIQDDIERIAKEPVLGKILHNHYKTNQVMLEFPKSNISESFRALRTNLDFYVRGGHKKVIMVTSCLEGEGKTFVALNLAMSYAQLGRKTVIVDFDLRKSETYFNENEAKKEGLSSYMINKIGLKDIITKSPHDKLDYIISGILPPNPVELMALDETEKLLTRLKQDYDIIVLDTTPLAQVTDGYLLMDHAELKILVTRQGYTPKKVFSLIIKDLLQKKVSNVCIVLNNNKLYSDQYGYGYGYNNKKSKKKKIRGRQKMVNYYSTDNKK